jgi:hypothetical protein
MADSHGSFKCSDTTECNVGNAALTTPSSLDLITTPTYQSCLNADDVAGYTTFTPPRICV